MIYIIPFFGVVMNKDIKEQNIQESEQAAADLSAYAPALQKRSLLDRFKDCLYNLSKQEKAYLVVCALLPIAINYLMYLAMGIHPFGDGSVLVLDLNGQYVYFYEALRSAVYGDASMIYSFCRALGGEFMGIYAYYVASPFSYIVCLFPAEKILDALLLIFLLKAGIAGFNFGYYLHSISSKTNKTVVVTFSVLYALTAYAVVQQHNSMWIDALMWLPLLTLSIEQMIKNKKYKLFVVMLALTLMSNFYIGYMTCIYVAAYFFYYFLAHNENNRNNPSGENHHMRRSLMRIALFSIIAIGVSMVIVATAAYSLGFGKNNFNNPSFKPELRFDLMDFFTKFLPGSYDTVRPEGLPFVYCGVVTLFLVPIFFTSKKFSVREKVASACFIMFFFLSFIISTFDLIWHGFQKPNWLNYRYSFMLCFFLLVLAYKGFGEIKKTSNKFIFCIAAALGLFLTAAQKETFHAYVERISGTVEFDQGLKDVEVIWFSLICIISYAIVLCVARVAKNKRAIALILCMLVCLEVFANGIVSCVEFGNDVIYSSYSSYTDFIEAFRPISNDILEKDKSFYRFEKTYMRKLCDNMALNIRGLSNSTSTLNKSTIDFLREMGYASKSHWSKYLGGNPVSDSLLGIKYIIGNINDNLDLYYETDEDIDPTTFKNKLYEVYVNTYALSIAYAVNEDIYTYDMSAAKSPMVRLNELYAAMLGRDEPVNMFNPITYSVTTSECSISGGASYHQYSGKGGTVTYTFTTTESGEVFFYLPSDYPREVDLTLDGKSMGTFYGNETSRIVSLGEHPANKTMRLTMTLKSNDLYVTKNADAIFSLDMSVFEEAINELKKNQLIVGEDWTQDDISGTMTTNQPNQTVMTTIPYDEGWIITVDGKEVENVEALGALVSFEIEDAGEHEVRLKYSPRSLRLGLVISILSIILFFLIVFFEKPLAVVVNRIFLESDAREVNKKLLEEAAAEDDGDEEATPPPKAEEKNEDTE